MHLTRNFHEVVRTLDEYQPDVIVNYCALSDVALSWEHAATYYETNLSTQVRLVDELAKRSWLKRFIHIGTSELYGPVTEPALEDDPLNPTSPYAVSKMAFDLHLNAMHRVKGFPMNILRPSNCYCPGQLLYRVIPKAVVCGLTGRKMPLAGGGKAEKSYMHATDLSRGIQMVAEAAPLGETYNLGPERWIPIRDLVAMTAMALDVKFEDLCEVTEGRIGEDSRYAVNSTKIADTLDWRPWISLTDGLFEMADWGRKYLDQLRDMPTDYVFRT
jgi:dTDP-glucose 4,6-dehydratase